MLSFSFHLPEIKAEKPGECQLSRFSPPRSDCMKEDQNQYIPFFLFCFLASSSPPEKSTAHCPMGFSPSISL